MSYYTALINEWATLPSGDTTAQKLAAINALTVPNTAAAGWTASPQQVCGCIVFSEFTALTQANRMEIWAMLGLGFPLPGGNTSPLGMIVVLMPQSTCPLTYANFVALAQTVAGSEPWWQANGYTAPITASDLVNAGGLA